MANLTNNISFNFGKAGNTQVLNKDYNIRRIIRIDTTKLPGADGDNPIRFIGNTTSGENVSARDSVYIETGVQENTLFSDNLPGTSVSNSDALQNPANRLDSTDLWHGNTTAQTVPEYYFPACFKADSNSPLKNLVVGGWYFNYWNKANLGDVNVEGSQAKQLKNAGKSIDFVTCYPTAQGAYGRSFNPVGYFPCYCKFRIPINSFVIEGAPLILTDKIKSISGMSSLETLWGGSNPEQHAIYYSVGSDSNGFGNNQRILINLLENSFLSEISDTHTQSFTLPISEGQEYLVFEVFSRCPLNVSQITSTDNISFKMQFSSAEIITLPDPDFGIETAWEDLERISQRIDELKTSQGLIEQYLASLQTKRYYAVGDYYITENKEVNPAQLFGGTWELIEDSQYLKNTKSPSIVGTNENITLDSMKLLGWSWAKPSITFNTQNFNKILILWRGSRYFGDWNSDTALYIRKSSNPSERIEIGRTTDGDYINSGGDGGGWNSSFLQSIYSPDKNTNYTVWQEGAMNTYLSFVILGVL